MSKRKQPPPSTWERVRYADRLAGMNGKVVVITGMSGAGRSTVAHALEDLGWYVVDNLPPALLANLCDMAANTASRIAVVIDVRGLDRFLGTQHSSVGAEDCRVICDLFNRGFACECALLRIQIWHPSRRRFSS